MRPRDDPTERRRRRPSARKRTRSCRRTETPLRGRRCRTGVSSALVPGATLAALAVGAILATVRAASGFLQEWSLTVAVLAVVAGCWLAALAVAHLAARVGARRINTGR